MLMSYLQMDAFEMEDEALHLRHIMLHEIWKRVSVGTVQRVYLNCATVDRIAKKVVWLISSVWFGLVYFI